MGQTWQSPLTLSWYPSSQSGLQSVVADGTDLAVSVDTQLVSVLTVWPAVSLGERLLSPGGQAHPTQLTAELSLLALVAPVAAGPTELRHLVVVLAGRALLPAVRAGGGTHYLRHPGNVGHGGTLG